MTMTLEAPATTRREKTMLKRQMAALAEPQTTTVAELPVGEPSTVVVSVASNPEQLAEVPTDTNAEAVTEPSKADDDADEFPVTKPRTGGLPMVAFEPLEKDMSDDEVPSAPRLSASPFFADDDDEFGVQAQTGFLAPRTEEEQEAFDLELEEKAALAKAALEAEEQARKEQEANDRAKEKARIKKSASRRALGKIMMFAGIVGIAYGAAVPFIPWL